MLCKYDFRPNVCCVYGVNVGLIRSVKGHLSYVTKVISETTKRGHTVLLTVTGIEI